MLGPISEPIYAGDERAEWLRGVLRMVHPFDSQKRRLAVIQLFGDTAGKPNNRVFAAACYLVAALPVLSGLRVALRELRPPQPT